MAILTRRRGFIFGTAALAGVAAVVAGSRFLDEPLLLDADIASYLKRCERQPTASQAAALSALVLSLKAFKLWDKLDALWDLQAETRQRALLNMKGNRFDLVIEGEMQQIPGFGLRGDGKTGFARTGLIPDMAGLAFGLDSATLGVFCSVNSNGGTNYAFGSDRGNVRLKTRQLPQEAPSGYLNDATQPLTGSKLSGLMPGMTLMARTSSTELRIYKNDAVVASAVQPSTSLSGNELFLGRAGGNFNSETFAFAFIGAGLSVDDVRALSAALRDYLVTSMRPLVCFGDSLTQGARNMGKSPLATTTNYPSVLQSMLKRIVYNGGISGQTSSEIRERAESDNVMNAAVNVIWAGRNNFLEFDTVLSDIDRIVKHLTHQRYVVMSVLNGDYLSEEKGMSGYDSLIRLNTELASRYGSRFLDIRRVLISAADPTNEKDAMDVKRDVVPGSLRSDTIHMNDKGDAIVGKAVAEFIQSKGW